MGSRCLFPWLEIYKMITETHYEWELQDASGEWVAGGSANDLADAEKEGQRAYARALEYGPHKLLIRKHQTELIEEVSLG